MGILSKTYREDHLSELKLLANNQHQCASHVAVTLEVALPAPIKSSDDCNLDGYLD